MPEARLALRLRTACLRRERDRARKIMLLLDRATVLTLIDGDRGCIDCAARAATTLVQSQR